MSIQGLKSIILIVVGFWIFISWHNVYGDYAACFDSEKDYRHFLIDNRNSSDYTVKFPCPTNNNLLNQTIPEDESGN
jgi:hypothetical protein